MTFSGVADQGLRTASELVQDVVVALFEQSFRPTRTA
jgi:hypothetical protein